jgi:hypothetical protein
LFLDAPALRNEREFIFSEQDAVESVTLLGLSKRNAHILDFIRHHLAKGCYVMLLDISQQTKERQFREAVKRLIKDPRDHRALFDTILYDFMIDWEAGYLIELAPRAFALT